MLGKKFLLGVTGSIAAYKAPCLVRALKEKGADVRVVLTRSAQAFVTKLTMQTLSEHEVYDELLDPVAESTMGHINLARWADHVLVAPASAHFIAKLRMGLADDLLSTLCLATTAPISIAPAMNQQMWLNVATQENVQHLKQRGIIFLGPDTGIQACGEDGPGRMLEPEPLVDYLAADLFLKGKRVLITAGPTHEAIDPVRFITNRSSGKMGYALAQEAHRAGATVILISGPAALPPPVGVHFISVVTAQEMWQAVQAHIEHQDVFISAAAVADYCVAQPSPQKIKKNSAPLTLALEPTMDILASVCRLKPKPFVVGFAAETNDILENAEKKRQQKGVDMMVVNDVSRSDIGFDRDENEVTLLSSAGTIVLDKAAKAVIARTILRQVGLS